MATFINRDNVLLPERNMIRGNIAETFAGGPQFRLMPSKMLVELEGGSSITEIAESLNGDREGLLDESPVEDRVLQDVRSELESMGFNVKPLNNLGALVVSADNLDSVIDNVIDSSDVFSSDAIDKLQRVRSKAQSGSSGTIVGGFGSGQFNFSEDVNSSIEANLRNELSDMSLHNPLTDALEEISGVLNAEIKFTRNTFGPRNLGVNIEERPTVRDALDVGLTEGEGDSDLPTLGDATTKMGVPSAWKETKGEGAVLAVFDTSFCDEYLKSDRVIDTFHGGDTESAYSAPEEGHGTMTAYSAGGDKQTSGLPYNGVAPECDLLLARVSNSSGGLSFIEEAWDWLAGWIKQLDRPVISSHSYGVPVCSGRSMDMCESTSTRIVEVLSSRTDHQAFYAAGNEAGYCGHRVGGYTNGINGVNSSPQVMTVGALRFDLVDAQTYSSHGWGTCTNLSSNPKPDVSCLLPSLIPYGCQVKDMSRNYGGSSGGTSEATPLTAGVATLVASLTGTAEQEVIQGVLEGTAKSPRLTQVNIARGFDARFGHGQVRAGKAIKEAELIEKQETSKSPNAAFSFDPQNPDEGEQVSFNATATSDPDSSIDSYSWDFGDGSTGQGDIVSHTYDVEGQYTVTLTVTDTQGNQDTQSQTVSVQNVEQGGEDGGNADNGENSGQSNEGNGNGEQTSLGPFGLLQF